MRWYRDVSEGQTGMVWTGHVEQRWQRLGLTLQWWGRRNQTEASKEVMVEWG